MNTTQQRLVDLMVYVALLMTLASTDVLVVVDEVVSRRIISSELIITAVSLKFPGVDAPEFLSAGNLPITGVTSPVKYG